MQDALAGSGRPLGWWTGLVACLVALLGCAGDLVRIEAEHGGGYQSRKLGFSVAHPAGPDATGWKNVSVEGADFAVRGPGGPVYSLSARCRKTRASVETLARHLFIGVEGNRFVEEGPIEHAGLAGYRQRVVTDSGGTDGAILIDAVTLKQGACVYDLLLVARGEPAFRAAEPVFERWWRSFVPGPAGAAATAGPGVVSAVGAAP
jgi:hypothetical protein